MHSEALVPGITEEEEMLHLVDSYSHLLLGMCSLILGDRDQAQDIVQETFVRAWKHRGLQRDNEKGWLIRVAVNLCHDYHRSRWWRNIEHRISADEVQIAVPFGGQSEILELDHQLPFRETEAIILFFWNNKAGRIWYNPIEARD